MRKRNRARVRLDLRPDVLHFIYKMGKKFLRQLSIRLRKEEGAVTTELITLKRTLGLWLLLEIRSEK